MIIEIRYKFDLYLFELIFIQFTLKYCSVYQNKYSDDIGEMWKFQLKSYELALVNSVTFKYSILSDAKTIGYLILHEQNSNFKI